MVIITTDFYESKLLKVSVNVVPSPKLLDTAICPLKAFTKLYTTIVPNPVPFS